MKGKADGLDAALKTVHAADKILDFIIAVMLICAVLYAGFGLWDDYMIFKRADVSEDILKYRPRTVEDGGNAQDNPTLSELQKINPDVCAWLAIDGTNIDYPVVQGKTNTEYLNKDVEGNFLMSGSIFLDHSNDRHFNDFYSLIYGHHMADKKMFGGLPEFLDKSFFDSHRTGTLFLPDKTYKIEIFACIQADGFDSMIFYPSGYASDISRQNLLNYIKKLSVQYEDIGLTTRDKIIGLSTCYRTTTNGRLIVFGRLSSAD